MYVILKVLHNNKAKRQPWSLVFNSVWKSLMSTGKSATGESKVVPGSPPPSLHFVLTDAHINQLGADTAIGSLTNVP